MVTYGYFSLWSWDQGHCCQNELVIPMIYKFLQKGRDKLEISLKWAKKLKQMRFLMTHKQILITYENIRAQRRCMNSRDKESDGTHFL